MAGLKLPALCHASRLKSTLRPEIRSNANQIKSALNSGEWRCTSLRRQNHDNVGCITALQETPIGVHIEYEGSGCWGGVYIHTYIHLKIYIYFFKYTDNRFMLFSECIAFLLSHINYRQGLSPRLLLKRRRRRRMRKCQVFIQTCSCLKTPTHWPGLVMLSQTIAHIAKWWVTCW